MTPSREAYLQVHYFVHPDPNGKRQRPPDVRYCSGHILDKNIISLLCHLVVAIGMRSIFNTNPKVVGSNPTPVEVFGLRLLTWRNIHL